MSLLLRLLREIHSQPGVVPRYSSRILLWRKNPITSVTQTRVEVFTYRHLRLLIDRNLVDPASSHMLVSKIKPCMSQYKSLHDETANGSLKQL